MALGTQPDGRCFCLAVNLPLHHKSRISLLAPAHPGGPGKRAVRWLWCGVVVVVMVIYTWYEDTVSHTTEENFII